MRVVLDTNTVVSGLLWDNQPRAIIAELIVSRDKHLRNLKHFHRIPILNATDALNRIIAEAAKSL